MTSFPGLLIREWREHRAAFLWSPAIVLALILLAGISAMTLNDNIEADVSDVEIEELEDKLGERRQQAGLLETLTAVTLDVAGSTDAELESKMDKLLDGIAQPFHIVFVIVAFFALIGCLYEERRDQSILFWKSMPVADWQTVLSKLTFVLWLAPLATIAGIFAAQFFAVLVSALFVESGMGGRIWAASDIWLRPFELISRYLVMGLWVLPLAGWAMLVSSAAPRLPILWVFGVPIVLSLLEGIVFGTEGLARMLSAHMSLWQGSESGSGTQVLGQFALLGDYRLWMGIVLGVLFLGAATFCRGRFNEL